MNICSDALGQVIFTKSNGMLGDDNNKPKSILIIDDEHDICFMLSNMLKQKAFSISAVHTIKDADDYLLQDNSSSLIFLDNNLPDGRGVDFLPQLKLIHPNSKVVMITAHDNPSDRDLALRSGADVFIGKPFTRQIIFTTVDKLLL